MAAENGLSPRAIATMCKIQKPLRCDLGLAQLQPVWLFGGGEPIEGGSLSISFSFFL